MHTEDSADETFSPWTVVNVVFAHLSEAGLHPTLGPDGNPSLAAGELLRALGIEPSDAGNSRITESTRKELSDLRTALMEAD